MTGHYKRRSTFRLAAIMGTLLASAGLRAQTSQPADAREPISARRIIKHFDFNERQQQNVGTVPAFWRPVRDEGFPAHLLGRFDEQVGHAGLPSFRLDINGGSIAYQYEGNDISVRPNSDYLITAWVKTLGLNSARAYMTAFFLDRHYNRLPATEHTTTLIGGSGKETDWEQINVGLTGNVPNARYLGLVLWICQQQVWDHRPKGLRDIQREDVKGTVWFDDITVFRLPRVVLRSANPGNVFDDNTPVVLRPEITDPDGLNLSAKLTVVSVDGKFHNERDVPVQAGATKPVDIRYEQLPIGLYEARLVASTRDTPLVSRSIRFARLATAINPPQSVGGGFGVILNTIEPAAMKGQHLLLSQLRPEWVKLPVWYTQRAIAGKNRDMDKTIDGYLQAIIDSGGNPVGVQLDEPEARKQRGSAGLRSMIDLMSEQPLAWKPLVADTWSRYTGLIHVWQFGEDGDENVYLDHRLPILLTSLRREMSSLMPSPTLATPASTWTQPANGAFGDYRAIYMPKSVLPEDIERHAEPLFGQHRSRAWITLETLDDSSYSRNRRLADYSRRLANAAFLKPGATYVYAPWDLQTDLIGAQLSPREEYLVLRTVTDLLGHAIPASKTHINGQVECMVFDRNGQATLFVCDPYAPPEGREHTLYLGEYAEQIDLWGRRTRLATSQREQKVRIGPIPSFITNTPTWLIEFRRQFEIAPILVEASFASRSRELKFKNTHREPISGVVRLIGPENWDIRPTRMMFALKPGQEFRQQIEIRYPINTEAGVKALLGEFSIDADRRYQFSVPAWFELGLRGLNLETCAFRKGDNAVFRVSMTNRTDESVSFDGDLIVPGRQRITRLFLNVMPGQSMTKEYALQQPEELIGRHVRVHLNERQGSRVWNRLVMVP